MIRNMRWIGFFPSHIILISVDFMYQRQALDGTKYQAFLEMSDALINVRRFDLSCLRIRMA